MRLFSILCLLSFAACDGTEDTADDVGTGDGTDMGTDSDMEGTEDPDSDSDSDADSDSDTEEGGDTGGVVDPNFGSYADDILHNQSLASSQGSCTSSAFDVVYPIEGFEHNYWAASRLVPGSDGFRVDAISIELYDDPSDNGCRVTTARSVRVAKQAGGDPVLRPSEIPGNQLYELTPEPVLQRDYLVTELSPSITLSGSEELWVFVQVESTSNGRTCLRGCRDNPQNDNNWFTSGQAGNAEPFTWRRLADFEQIEATNYLIEAYELP